MRFSAIISVAALAGSAAAIPLAKRDTTCQALSCLIKLEPVISDCMSAGEADLEDASKDMTCLKDVYSTLTAWPSECGGCASALLDGSLDISSVLSTLGITGGSLGTIESIISEISGATGAVSSASSAVSTAISSVSSSLSSDISSVSSGISSVSSSLSGEASSILSSATGVASAISSAESALSSGGLSGILGDFGL